VSNGFQKKNAGVADSAAGQDFNRQWWEGNPMRYDWRDSITCPEFTPEFFDEIDRRFISESRTYLKWQYAPFDNLIDYSKLRDCNVLEIGVGCGSHAELLSHWAKSFVGIDLTTYATQATRQRFNLKTLRGSVVQMDAEGLAFADNQFDYIWSWGVIHHSCDTKSILSEMRRVLKPGGTAITMVYHRSLWNYYVITGFLGGLYHGHFLKGRSLRESIALQTDGSVARFYSVQEWKKLASDYFRVEHVYVFGPKADLLPIPAGSLKSMADRLLPDSVARFLTHRCRLGTLLVSAMQKPLEAS
jgi:ubiquinone/menaquinone biosynthesis C-methylase UbiE